MSDSKKKRVFDLLAGLTEGESVHINARDLGMSVATLRTYISQLADERLTVYSTRFNRMTRHLKIECVQKGGE